MTRPVKWIEPLQAEELLGVTSRTLARWADQGLLGRVDRTVGGHRRYQLAEVRRLKRELAPPKGDE